MECFGISLQYREATVIHVPSNHEDHRFLWLEHRHEIGKGNRFFKNEQYGEETCYDTE